MDSDKYHLLLANGQCLSGNYSSLYVWRKVVKNQDNYQLLIKDGVSNSLERKSVEQVQRPLDLENRKYRNITPGTSSVVS